MFLKQNLDLWEKVFLQHAFPLMYSKLYVLIIGSENTVWSKYNLS